MPKKSQKTDLALNALLLSIVIVGLLFSVQVSGLLQVEGQAMPMYGQMRGQWIPQQTVQQYPVYTFPNSPNVQQLTVNGHRIWVNRASVRRTDRIIRHNAAPLESSSSSSSSSAPAFHSRR